MKKYLIVLLILLGSAVTLDTTAQEMPNLLPNTPEAAALIQKVDYPINYCNGLPDISIPFHTINIKNIELPVSISYRPGGFKANEKADVAGLGWSLSTDIQISRVVKGLDDFKRSGSGDGAQFGYYYQDEGRVNYGFYKLDEQGYTGETYDRFAYLKALHENYRGNIDIEPDCFYYSLLSGKSGKFYFQKTEGTPITIVQVPYTGVRIELLSVVPTVGFKITDLDGTEYIYRGDDTEVNTGHLGLSGFSQDYANMESGYISSWKCSEIITADKKETLHFFYEPQGSTYSFSGQDYIELFYNSTYFNAYYVTNHETTPEEILEAIAASSPENYGITSAIFTDDLHQTVICPSTYYSSQFFNYCNYNQYSIYNSPIYYTRHCTGSGSSIVVPVFGNWQPDNLVVEDDNLQSPVIVRKQERLRLKDIYFTNGSIHYGYSGSQLRTIDILNNYLFNKKINFYQSTSCNTGTGTDDLNDHGYSAYLDGTTSYLDSISISTDQDTLVNLSYKFSYNNKVGFANYTKAETTFGEYSDSNPTVAGHLILGDMSIYPSDDVFCGQKFVFGKTYQGIMDYCSASNPELPPSANNVIYGDHFAGMLTGIKYPTGLSDNFQWQPNLVYTPDEALGVGGVRIKEIASMEDYKLLKKRIFKYGRDELGCGFLKNYVNNNYEVINNPAVTFECNTFAVPLSFNGIDDPSNASPAYLLKNYFSKAEHYTLLELKNENYTGSGGVDYSSRFDDDVRMSWGEFHFAFNATSDPKYEYQYEKLKQSKVLQFHPNTAGNIPFSYNCPVYYDVVTEYREEGGANTGKTVYKYNTEAGNFLFGTFGHYGIYNPPAEWAYGHLVSKTDYKARDNGGVIVFDPVRSVTNTYKYIPGCADVFLSTRHFDYLTNATKNMALFNYIRTTSGVPDFFTPTIDGWDRTGYVIMDTTVVKTYSDGGCVTETSLFEYDENLLLAKKVTTMKSSGETINTLYGYSNTDCPVLANQGRLNSLINKQTYVNDVLKESVKNVYSNSWLSNNSLVALQKIQTSTLDNPLEDRILYHNYDEYGNPADVSKNNDVHQTYIWGYDQTYPVAKFDNLSYPAVSSNSTLMNYLNQLQNYTDLTDATVRSNLKTLNDNIRNNVPAGAMVTTFTYIPLVGMTSQTDPNGVTTYYEYDPLGRLKTTLDNESKVTRHYKYHYGN